MAKTDSQIDRRQFLGLVGSTAAVAATSGYAAEPVQAAGAIRGEPTAEKVGMQVLAEGGNAIDAIVAAALTAAVVVPHQTGMGGYGGHATLALDGGKKITSIDFNTMAPAAATANMFTGAIKGPINTQKNMYGWLSAGVPGILAGLELTLKRYGTRSFRDMLQPAIGLAKNGFPFGGAAVALKPAAKRMSEDPGSRVLYFRDGKPLEATDHYFNPDLARMLETLAQDNSTESFYRGDIAKRIASAFAENGGIVTAADMAAYEAREVEPMETTWGDWSVHTAPLTSGGPTIIELMMLLKELKWDQRDPATADTLMLYVEAFRFAWQDRLEFFGDPARGRVVFDELFEPDTVRSGADLIEKAVATKKPLTVRMQSQLDKGTINLSAVDKEGEMAALTLTHGGSFGSGVTVPGLGLTLGHGMSRFEPRRGWPNSPGPSLRPLNNMCPTIVCKNGQPMYAVGARGGRKIPNAVAEVLLQIVARGKSLAEAVAAPRMHTEGTLDVQFERAWPADSFEELKNRGYKVTTAASATVSAAGKDAGGKLVSAMR
jgi:gamma-glutamyltranspeptidase / glutathione hydrolase